MLDFTRPLMTKQDKPIRILTSDALGKFPHVGMVKISDTWEGVEMWTEDGLAYFARNNDIKYSVKYVHVYLDVNGGTFTGIVHDYISDDLMNKTCFKKYHRIGTVKFSV